MKDSLPIDSLAMDSLTADSLTADSAALPVPGETASGLVMVSDVMSAGDAPERNDGGMSWIFLGISLLFCVIGLRFQNSSRYLKALVVDLTQTRTRQNAFDETVNETSFLLLLNLLWAVCGGVLWWFFVRGTMPSDPAFSFGIPDRPAVGMGLCMGICAVYLILMQAAYWMVGTVFTDPRHTRIWMKGATASYALCSMLFFPLAMLALCYSGWVPILLRIAAGVFIFSKIVFIFQGFRIFFTQFSSWLLFLYYLCSLEIVPLTITYFATLQICSLVL